MTVTEDELRRVLEQIDADREWDYERSPCRLVTEDAVDIDMQGLEKDVRTKYYTDIEENPEDRYCDRVIDITIVVNHQIEKTEIKLS